MNKDIIKRFVDMLGEDAVLNDKGERVTYERDAYPLERALPLVTVLPQTTQQVADIVKLCAENNIIFTPRGAGTGLAGGAVSNGGVIIGLSRMNRILNVDLRNRRIKVQAGVVNVNVTKEVTSEGYMFAPDPSSQGASTIGGNIGNNAGGPHTLKYGVTVNHVLGVELVLPNGEIIELGDKTEDTNGYDLIGLVTGSEGTFGVITAATLRLVRTPKSIQTLLAIFDNVNQATQTVSEIIASGIVPAALEMMDNTIIQTVEDAFHYGFPRDAGAVLIIEVDGIPDAVEVMTSKSKQVCINNGAKEVRQAVDAADRAKLWAARKKAVGTLGRLAPSAVTQDCVIPRTKLPEVLQAISIIGAKYQLRIANVFHAGDGNLHPVTLFDERNAAEVDRVNAASKEILELCVGLGGTLTGEHGIGVEKRDYMPLLFPAETLATMELIRDVFNTNGLCNPGKVLPSSHGCSYDSKKISAKYGAFSV